MRLFQIVLLATAVSLTTTPQFASAQINCPAGKTANGDCANPLLLSSAREIAIIYSQPNISHTAYPVLPFKDLQYRYPNSLIPSQQLSPAITLVLPSDTNPATEVLINGKIQSK